MKRLRKRICGAGILFLMTILALGTMVSFAEEKSTSYKLTIQKIFASGTPAGAKDVTYTFRVEAEVKGQKEPVEQTVRITGEGSEVISFGNAFKISVIEQTDDGGFHDDTGNEWDVINTYCESSMHVGASQATVNISRDGGMIKVTRPADVPTVTFRLTGKPFHSGNGTISIPGGTDQTVAAGGTAEWTNLPQGEYTITKLRSADGFSVLVGERSFYVDAPDPTNPKAPDPVGIVHINGSDSTISIEAPAANPEGPKRIHHYLISGPVTREIDVRSGEIGVVEHLTEGDYTITVSETYGGTSGYRILTPQTSDTPRAASFSQFDGKYYYVTVGGDYIDTFKYGGLTRNGSLLPESTLYKFYFGIYMKQEDGSLVRKNWVNSSAKGNTNYGENKTFYPGENKRFFVKVVPIEGHDISGSSCALSWVEHTRKQVNYKMPKSGTWYKVPIDDRGYFTIEKPADTSDPRSGEVIYKYTITDSNRNPVTGFTVNAWDNATGNKVDVTVDGSTVALKAGQSAMIGNLKGKNFRICEEATPAPTMGFTVTLNDTEKRVTTPGKSIEIETKDARKVEISRPGNSIDDGNRLYTYNIYKIEQSNGTETETLVHEIHLHSGERTTVAEQTGDMLPKGKYRIKAMDDEIAGFDVTYSDSSSLTSDYIKEADVTFTNHFGPTTASYHVVHEYYLKNEDGSYTLEGVSPVYTKNCGKSETGGICDCENRIVDPGDGHHYSKGLHLLNVYGGKEYTHIPDGGDAYGKVVSWSTGGTERDVMQTTGATPSDDNRFVLNGRSESGEDENGYKKYQYSYMPVKDQTSAEALPHVEEGEHGADIIILRYYRENTEKHGTYNVIHEYYQRTERGDKWEGSSALSTVDVGLLTNENRYHTYDAKDVTPVNFFTPTIGNANTVEYPYVHDSTVYGRISDGNNASDKPGNLGAGKVYRTDATMNSVQATEAGDQIIILRYYRGGGYKVVHEYYYREATAFSGGSGDTEAAPGDTTGENPAEGEAQASYSENNLQQDNENTAEDQNTVSGNNPPGTEEIFNDTPPGAEGVSGDSQPEAAVLSTIPPQPDSYGTDTTQNVENSISGNSPQDIGGAEDASQDGGNDISGNNPQNTDDTANAVQNEKENTVAEVENAELEDYGIMPLDGVENSFSGTLTDGDGYVYSFEGRKSIISCSADLESTHDESGVTKEISFQPAGDEKHNYAFKDAVYGYMDGPNTDTYSVSSYMTGVTATSDEDEIIILRYIRGEGVEEPEQPTPPETPSGGGGSNPPPEDPEIPEIPDLPTELPDPNDPDSPDRITILEDGVPKTYVKVWDFDNQEWIYIPEEEVPLWKTSPQTADGNIPGFWFVLAAGSAGGIILLRSTSKKKR